MAAFSTTLLEFSACRALSGIGYSLVTIACQGYLGETAAPGSGRAAWRCSWPR